MQFACFSASPQATHYVDITGWLERGIESLEQHRAYLDHVGTDAREMLTNWAVATGAKVGCEHAASFEVIRP